MSVLAIDLWDKRCWMAIEVEWFSLAKEIVSRTSIISVIKNYDKEYCCHTIVVGLPYDLYGKNMRQLNKTQKFIKKLEIIFPQKKIIGFDERFTSFEADNILQEFWIKNTKWLKDAISAQIILENYLGREENRRID